jgi:hypothetical protein
VIIHCIRRATALILLHSIGETVLGSGNRRRTVTSEFAERVVLRMSSAGTRMVFERISMNSVRGDGYQAVRRNFVEVIVEEAEPRVSVTTNNLLPFVRNLAVIESCN